MRWLSVLIVLSAAIFNMHFEEMPVRDDSFTSFLHIFYAQMVMDFT